jgi:DNA-binding winged helix-turn-helix (wHTH) protein
MSDIKFDRETGKVVSMGVEVVISTKERILFGVLLESPGHVRSKDELIDFVWPERAGWNDSSNLTQLVSKLRRSLRPTGIDKFIITCGREGYKFVQSGDAAPRQSMQRRELAAILSVAVFLGVIFCFIGDKTLASDSVDMRERDITVKGVTVTLHIIDSPSLEPEWIEHRLESSIDPSTTDVFAAKRGKLVYIATLGDGSGKTSVIDLEEQ